MAGGSDVRGILELGDNEESGFMTKDAIFNSVDTTKKVSTSIIKSFF